MNDSPFKGEAANSFGLFWWIILFLSFHSTDESIKESFNGKKQPI